MLSGSGDPLGEQVDNGCSEGTAGLHDSKVPGSMNLANQQESKLHQQQARSVQTQPLSKQAQYSCRHAQKRFDLKS